MSVYNRGDGGNPGGTGYRPMPWAYWLAGLSGLWLLISPWVLQYTLIGRAFWTAVILGALILIFSFIRPFVPDRGHWIWWVVGILGILAFISPWVLAFVYLPGAFWSEVIVGAIAVIVAAIAIFTPRTTTPTA